MSESLPQLPEQSRFDSPRDEVLYRMGQEEWAAKSSGDVQTLPGWFCWLSNQPEDLSLIASAFSDTIATAELQDMQELVGNFVVHEDAGGAVRVSSFDSSDRAQRMFESLQEVFDTFG